MGCEVPGIPRGMANVEELVITMDGRGVVAGKTQRGTRMVVADQRADQVRSSY
jgi:hypothetical protein